MTIPTGTTLLKIAGGAAAVLAVEAAVTPDPIQFWILGAMLSILLLLIGVGIKWVYDRLTRAEDKIVTVSERDIESTAVTRAQVSLIEGRVTVLEGGSRLRLDLKLDAMLREQIQQAAQNLAARKED